MNNDQVSITDTPPPTPILSSQNDPSCNKLEIYQTMLRDLYHIYQDKQLLHSSDSIEYRASQYALHKLDTIMTELTDTIDVHYQSFEKREEYRKYLEHIQREYVENFLKNHTHQLFYIHKTDVYIQYNGNVCTIVNENTISHQILTEISDASHPLFNRRYLVKKQLLAQLKHRNLLGTTPSSETIQRILGFLTPTFIENKEGAKYFMTVIGDMLLKKNSSISSQSLIYLVDPIVKPFIDAIEKYIYFYWAGSIRLDGFKYKYYDHEYERCRLIRFHTNIQQENIWYYFLKENILDFVMVATHYSMRYKNADELLDKTYDEELRNYSRYLLNHSKEDVVQQFIRLYLVKQESIPDNSLSTEQDQHQQEKQHPSGKIKWIQMVYLWRLYVEKEGIPSIVMLQQLKEILIQSGLSFDSDLNVFHGVTSKSLHTVQDFERFWSTTLETKESEQLELGEVLIAYNNWAKHERTEGNSVSQLTENMVLTFVKYFHNEHEVDGRVIYGIMCRDWKREEILIGLMSSIMSQPQESPLDSSGNVPRHWTDVYDEISSKWNLSDGPMISMNYFHQWLKRHDYGDLI